MIVPTPDITTLADLREQFKQIEWPDRKLVQSILEMLGIFDLIELDFTLNSLDKRERLAAMKMIERNLDDLTSGNLARWADAKDTLKQIYYKVEEIDEEGFL
jgi:hypothetical protein